MHGSQHPYASINNFKVFRGNYLYLNRSSTFPACISRQFVQGLSDFDLKTINSTFKEMYDLENILRENS
jgi:hypothetical protein